MTPFLAVLIGGFIYVLIHINVPLLSPMVFVPALLFALAARRSAR